MTTRGLGLDDPQRENEVLLAIIEATSSGPGVEPLAAAVARVITEATATDVCFVHVLDDTERSLTLAGATPPFDAQVGPGPAAARTPASRAGSRATANPR